MRTVRTFGVRPLLLALAVAVGLVSALPRAEAVGSPPSARELQVALTLAPRDKLKPRIPSAKPVHTPARSGLTNRIYVKFRQGSLVRLRNGGLTTLGQDDLSGVKALIKRHPGLRFIRMYVRPELQIAQGRTQLEARAKEELADLNLWYKAFVPRGRSSAKVADELNALPLVEIAYPEPAPEPAPGGPSGPAAVTPDFTVDQDYKNFPGEGIGADAAYSLGINTNGAFVKIYDIEYGWNVNHEDLSKARAAGAVILNGTPSNPFSNDHGTAVLGELVADNNGFGVTGIAYGAAIRMVNQRNTQVGQARGPAIDKARLDASPGDVILLEMQVQGPNGGCSGTSQVGCAPSEWEASVYDAIKLAIAANIYVVEAAGNGEQNLDGPEYATWRNKGPSGAFIVGAGGGDCGTLHKKMSFSNYGSMIFLQGWGQCVTTTGYGYLQGSSESNDAYLGSFSGTSSASPIVAGAVALYSSVYQDRFGSNQAITPGLMHFILALSATPQVDPGDGKVGGLPNLVRALNEYDNIPPATPLLFLSDANTGNGSFTNGATLSVGSTTDNFGVKEYFVSENPAAPAENDPGWRTASDAVVTPSAGDGLKTFYVWAKDNNKNISAGGQSTITLDATPPTATLTAPVTTNKRVTPITVAGADTSSGVVAYFLRSQNPTPPLEDDPLWLATLPTTYTFTGGSGTKTLYAWTKDLAGNVSPAAQQMLIFDNKKPIVTITQPVLNSAQPELKQLRGTANDNLAPQYRFANFALGKRLGGGLCAWWNPRKAILENAPCLTPKRFLIKHNGNIPNWVRNIGKLDTPGTYFLVVRYVDVAGNIGQATVKKFQITASPGTPPPLAEGR